MKKVMPLENLVEALDQDGQNLAQVQVLEAGVQVVVEVIVSNLLAVDSCNKLIVWKYHLINVCLS